MLYNNETSALRLGLSSDGYGRKYASIRMAPVFKEMAGKVPTKGELVYDYDNMVFVSLNVEEMSQLKYFISMLAVTEAGIESEKKDKTLLSDFEVTATKTSKLRLVRASSVDETGDGKGYGDPMDFMLFISRSDDVTCCFKFKSQKASIFKDLQMPLKKGDDEIVLQTNFAFSVFCDWVTETYRQMVSAIDYEGNAARRAKMMANQNRMANYGPASSTYPSSRQNNFNNWKNGGTQNQPAPQNGGVQRSNRASKAQAAPAPQEEQPVQGAEEELPF